MCHAIIISEERNHDIKKNNAGYMERLEGGTEEINILII